MALTSKEPIVAPVLRRLAISAWHWMAATQTAITLIALLALVLALATVIEGAWGRDAVQWYVYKTSWFAAIFVLLAVNILAALLIRFPWNRRRTGFVITHIGLLTVLLGMAQSFVGGIDGRVALEEGATADSIALTYRDILEVARLDKTTQGRVIFSFLCPPQTWLNDKVLNLGAVDDVQLSVLARRDVARFTNRSSSTGPARQTFGNSGTAVLVELRDGNETQKCWLERDGTGKTIRTSAGPMRLTFASERLPLGFSLELVEFHRKRNPGGFGDASFVSRIRVIDKRFPGTNVSEVSMNRPLTYRGFLFSQMDFIEATAGKNVSILGVTRDPGRYLKYLGITTVCIGTLLTFLTRIACPCSPSAPSRHGNPPARTDAHGATDGVR